MNGQRMAVLANTLASFAFLLFAGCGEPYRSKQMEAQELIDDWIPIGTRRESALRTLRVRDLPFRLIQSAECEDFANERRFNCRGGSAVLLTNQANLWSWQEPLSTPNLKTFLAFDGEERLADYTIFLDAFD